MMADLEHVVADLAVEQHDLDALVVALDDDGWDAPTPAEGWAVRDQISHLAFFDGRARLALTDPAAFVAEVEAMLADPRGSDALMEEHLTEGRSLAPAEIVGWWRAERAGLLSVLAGADPSLRVPWYGPPMSVVSFATARLMETWAHGQDVADTMGVTRLPTARLRHVAHIGVRALPYSFTVRGLPVPSEPVLVELRSPDRELWTWGPDDAADQVRGSALDFCLAVTQRRHCDDLHLEVVGPVANQWMSIAQAFAGGPGPGRGPGQFGAAT
ncbi:MAG: TIGR03084 family metal-binding protein [Acidimicrobiales bacterium]